MVTRRRRWKVDFYQIVFLMDSLAAHDDTWHLPAPPQQEGKSACLGLALLWARAPKSFNIVTATSVFSSSPFWPRPVFPRAQTVWFLPCSGLKYTLMREEMILLNELLSSPFRKSQLYRERQWHHWKGTITGLVIFLLLSSSVTLDVICQLIGVPVMKKVLSYRVQTSQTGK